jgi:hypothetical protein
MERAYEIRMIMDALKEYLLQHQDLSIGQVISNISQQETKNFDPGFLDDKTLYKFLIENINNED